MNISVCIIDHEKADLAVREVFACGRDKVQSVYQKAKEHPDILGAVLILTCNRTELYLSLKEGDHLPGKNSRNQECPAEECRPDRANCSAKVDPYVFLCTCLGVDPAQYADAAVIRSGEDVLRHLCLLTAGAKSRLWGDSQIITQAGDAIREAQEAGAADNILNTVFRLGITAGKKIRTNVSLHIHDDSTADQAVRVIQKYPEIRKVLVIGNGMIGHLVAQGLLKVRKPSFGNTVNDKKEGGEKTGTASDAEYEILMTLRQYHNRQATVPEGVTAVPYTERYAVMEDCDAVISTTASPHVVVERAELEKLASCPALLIDMAVPRDIEPSVAEMSGVTCLNIDDISGDHTQELMTAQLEELTPFVDPYIEELRRWNLERVKKEAAVVRLTDPDRNRGERRYFPLFVDSMDRKVIVVGGGNIAERRVMTLAEFGFSIEVISGKLTDTLKQMADGGAITWTQGHVVFSGDIAGKVIYEKIPPERFLDVWLVLACTNDRELNHDIGVFCREAGMLVNICDARNESTFWFPAVGLSDELTMGLVGTGTDHMNVKKAAAKLRNVIEEKSYK